MIETRCPSDDELFDLVSGDATENRAAVMRAHLARCASCGAREAELRAMLDGLRAPIVRIDTAAHVAGVMGRLGLARPARARSRLFVVATAFAAAAAAALVVPRVLTERSDTGFQARGGPTSHELGREVGVELSTLAGGVHRLSPGERVEASAAYTASYRSVRTGSPAYLLLFAVDAAGVVHWLYPAYETLGSDPPSLELAASPAERALASSVVLERPAAGPMRFFSVVTARPARVSEVEAMPASAIDVASLRARFVDSAVGTWSVLVAHESEKTP